MVSVGRSHGQIESPATSTARAPTTARIRRDVVIPGARRSAPYQATTVAADGAGRWTMAAGSAAATETTARSAIRTSQSVWKSSAARTPEASSTSSVSMPRVVATAASGTTSRLATTPISES